MIICICNNINEEKARNLVKEPGYFSLDKPCGKCRKEFKRIWQEEFKKVLR